MAVVGNLLTKTESGGQNEIINDIRAMLFATDTAVQTTDALVIAEAISTLVADGIPLPDDYFDTVVLLSVYDAEADYTVFDGKTIAEVIA